MRLSRRPLRSLALLAASILALFAILRQCNDLAGFRKLSWIVGRPQEEVVKGRFYERRDVTAAGQSVLESTFNEDILDASSLADNTSGHHTANRTAWESHCGNCSGHGVCHAPAVHAHVQSGPFCLCHVDNARGWWRGINCDVCTGNRDVASGCTRCSPGFEGELCERSVFLHLLTPQGRWGDDCPIALKNATKGVLIRAGRAMRSRTSLTQFGLSSAAASLLPSPLPTDNELPSLIAARGCGAFRIVRRPRDRPESGQMQGPSIAYLIVAHHSIAHLSRLLSSIEDPNAIVMVHIDAKVPAHVFESAKALVACRAPRVRLCTHRSLITYSGFSRLEADIICIRELHEWSEDWTHVVNLSGLEYPAMAASARRAYIRGLGNHSAIASFASPQLDWRFQREFAEGNGEVTWTGRTRQLPVGIETMRHGSAYNVLSRTLAAYAVGNAPEIVTLTNFCRGVYSPDELYWATLASQGEWKSNNLPRRWRAKFIKWQKRPWTQRLRH
eukprot:Opistho-2@68329